MIYQGFPGYLFEYAMPVFLAGPVLCNCSSIILHNPIEVGTVACSCSVLLLLRLHHKQQ